MKKELPFQTDRRKFITVKLEFSDVATVSEVSRFIQKKGGIVIPTKYLPSKAIAAVRVARRNLIVQVISENQGISVGKLFMKIAQKKDLNEVFTVGYKTVQRDCAILALIGIISARKTKGSGGSMTLLYTKEIIEVPSW